MATYQAGFSTYDAKSKLELEHDDENHIEDDKYGPNTRTIVLFYTTTDVKVSTTSLKIDLNTFVSNVGGSLGLFIGFSVLGVFFFINDVICSKNMK